MAAIHKRGFAFDYVADTREQDFRGFMVARAARIFSVAIPAIILTATLDLVGFQINELAYPEGYRAWDLPVIRVITSTLFLNEIWALGIQLFTNVPYWSLNYEVWYYVLFGVLFFFEGRRKWFAFGVLCLLLGPKIILLLPVWWMGVWIYRSPSLVQIALDADNTLWGGVIGEDGINGIALGKEYPGRAFVDFQKRLLSLQQRGFLLVLGHASPFESQFTVSKG